MLVVVILPMSQGKKGKEKVTGSVLHECADVKVLGHGFEEEGLANPSIENQEINGTKTRHMLPHHSPAIGLLADVCLNHHHGFSTQSLAAVSDGFELVDPPCGKRQFGTLLCIRVCKRFANAAARAAQQDCLSFERHIGGVDAVLNGVVSHSSCADRENRCGTHIK